MGITPRLSDGGAKLRQAPEQPGKRNRLGKIARKSDALERDLEMISSAPLKMGRILCKDRGTLGK